jgi:hypothetical protein
LREGLGKAVAAYRNVGIIPPSQVSLQAVVVKSTAIEAACAFAYNVYDSIGSIFV